MKSRKPWSSIKRRTTRVKPKAPARVPIGCCLLCGEIFTGPKAIRLRHGCIQWDDCNASLIRLPFDDHDNQKWVCYGCGLDYYILADEGYQFSSHLDGLSSEGWCCLCKKEIEPYHGDPYSDWSSALLIELGSMVPSGKSTGSLFKAADQGHLHYECMSELNIELWSIIGQSDVPPPDYREELDRSVHRAIPRAVPR